MLRIKAELERLTLKNWAFKNIDVFLSNKGFIVTVVLNEVFKIDQSRLPDGDVEVGVVTDNEQLDNETMILSELG